jgi:hypothetical protein
MQLCEILQQLEGLNFPALTENQRADLDRLVSQEEREAAVFQLGPTKASGSDGLPMVFYQRFWGVVRPEQRFKPSSIQVLQLLSRKSVK